MHRGFSLVELSIVLVILGLLTGGILTGQSLIRAAELRAVSGEYGRYITAVQTFRDKYMAIPGDMRNATKFWTADIPANCVATSTTSTANTTCDGNGDGGIGLQLTDESYRLWQHLAYAGLVEGTYTGTTGGASNTYTSVSGNSPGSKISNSLWWAWAWNAYNNVGEPTYLPAIPSYGNVLMLGGRSNNFFPAGGIVSPEEMWNIDTKLDDGRPGQGKLVPRPYVGCSTAATVADLAAEYAFTTTSKSCAFVFNRVF